MSEGLSEVEHQLWRSFLSANLRLLERLDNELQRRSRLSLTDFAILTELAGAGELRIRMSELADRVAVSRSRLTYRVDRLVRLGYVKREECQDDRRGLFAILTERGSAALGAATAGHVQDIRAWFFSSMNPDELATLGRVVSRMDTILSAT